MGIVLGIILFLLCWLTPPVLILRTNPAVNVRKRVWAAAAFISPILFAAAVQFATKLLGRALGLSEAEILVGVGGLGFLNTIQGVGAMTIGFLLYQIFKRRHATRTSDAET